MIYENLDELILRRIRDGGNVVTFSSMGKDVNNEADRLAFAGGKSFRIVDRRLQALRKKGLIRFISKQWVTA
jgi:hypothetical protein